MKWGKGSNKAGEKITDVVGNLFGVKGLYILGTIAAFALLIGAGSKWGI